MKPEDAIQLVNWYPFETYCETRKGISEHCDTAETSPIYTLAVLEAGTVNKMIAASNGKFFDVSTASPSTLATGFSTDDWSHTYFSASLFFANDGGDAPQRYDGSTWSAPAFTGPTLTTLNFVTNFKSRIYFVQKNSQSFWYGGVGSVAGALTEFDLSETGTFGGTLFAVGSIPIDGGAGPDDVFWALMSSGELILYSGSNPGSDFSRIGVFRIGRPVGTKQGIERVGNDVFVATEDGVVSLQKVLPYGRTAKQLSLSNKIDMQARYAADTYGGNSGWDIAFYPRNNALYVNIPRSASLAEQYVCNLSTGSWCRFTGMNGGAWALFSGTLYMGGLNGKVYQADTGTSDDGTAIDADAITAWDYFGQRGGQKFIHLYRPILGSVDTPGVVAAIGSDFEKQITTNSLSVNSITSGAVWDVAVWDVAIWGGGNTVTNDWLGDGRWGYTFALRLRSTADDQTIVWYATDFVIEQGGII